ncbi:3-hydroxylacyl-ACP dehydratase [Oxalicibacterium faecigallinarum]|uniref:Phosphotransferase n=1 Tax=Oxalicibacterium faecigallinarum TaxID=573741 RepID=A0A8J3ASB1_9BURK|nr:3-hydroxylacyl-ACP dehydratase [Oxalicibacterium faecigallinarum]GGI20032.1 phosphotransferase [Oxalicibacterium faecigallinarum]
MIIDREWMTAHIPHQGDMCLLDRVESWDAARMIAVTASHLSPTNPLRAHGRLGAANGIEYAAQAMAVHTALLMTSKADAPVTERPTAGFLASVRNTTFHAARLDDLDESLQVEVTLTHSEPNCILYQFAVRGQHSQKPLLDGRATVIIDASMVTDNMKGSAA